MKQIVDGRRKSKKSGNAVPVVLAQKIAEAIKKML